MKPFNCFLVLALLGGVGGMLLTPQTAIAADRSPPVRVVLTVDAADVPRPALRHSLFHDLVDQFPGNGAVAYARATRLLLQQESWQDDAVQCANWLNQPLDELPEREVSALLERYRTALAELIKATRHEQCDWEIPIRREGFNALLPHLSELRAAARLLALDTRLAIRQGRFDDAVERLRAGLSLARHVGDGGLLIEGLVGVAVAHQMLEMAEDLVAQPGSPNLYWALTDLPHPYLDFWRATLWERASLYIHFPLLREVGKRPITAADLQRALVDLRNVGNLGMDAPPPAHLPTEDTAALSLAGLGWVTYPLARQGLIRQGMTPEQVDDLSAAEILVRYVGGAFALQRDNLLKWSALPYPQARIGMTRAEAELEAAIERDPIENLFARMLLPALSRASDRFAELDRQFAVLRCVEAIRFHAARHSGQLPASLDLIEGVPVPVDPMSGQRFVYRLEGRTAILESPPVPGEPVRRPKIYEITIRR